MGRWQEGTEVVVEVGGGNPSRHVYGEKAYRGVGGRPREVGHGGSRGRALLVVLNPHFYPQHFNKIK